MPSFELGRTYLSFQATDELAPAGGGGRGVVAAGSLHREQRQPRRT